MISAEARLGEHDERGSHPTTQHHCRWRRSGARSRRSGVSEPALSLRALAAVGVSTLGTRMSFLALPWLVLTTTHSAALTGLVSFAEMAPYVTVQALGGPVIDRVGVRVTSVGTDIVAAASWGGPRARTGPRAPRPGSRRPQRARARGERSRRRIHRTRQRLV